MDQIRVLLVGGPADLTGAARVRDVSNMTESVKIARGAGYEHFRYSGETGELDGCTVPVFRWCDRTRIAE